MYKLKKALYGLKQAPKAWNKRIDSFLVQEGLTRCVVEYGVYVKWENTNDIILIFLYVDDLLVNGSATSEINNFKRRLMTKF